MINLLHLRSISSALAIPMFLDWVKISIFSLMEPTPSITFRNLLLELVAIVSLSDRVINIRMLESSSERMSLWFKVTIDFEISK